MHSHRGFRRMKYIKYLFIVVTVSVFFNVLFFISGGDL